MEGQERNSSGWSILVVDDDPAIRTVVAEALTSEGYSVTIAANGAEALFAVEQRRPAMVLLDMWMPGVDGWAFARRLSDDGIMVPTVVMTAAHHARQWAAEIGAKAYLAKPFDLVDLVAIVDRVVRESTTRRPDGAAHVPNTLEMEQQLEQAKLEGVLLAGREASHRLNNNLAEAIGILELLRLHRGLPATALELIAEAERSIENTVRDIDRFRKVTRVATRSTPIGLALDLERSTD